MDKPREDFKVRAIRKDVVIGESSLIPIPELVKEIQWLYNEALSGNLRELAYAASDMSLNPIYNIVGESVNFTMMAATLDVVKQEYFNNVTYPSIKKEDLEDGDN
jgi:hypothetical protein